MKDQAMNNTDKVRVLLPHWIEHNQGHRTEFSRWAEMMAADTPEIAALLRSAAEALDSAEHLLQEALHNAGGPLAAPGHGHHHH
jgi:hypothetical protein